MPDAKASTIAKAFFEGVIAPYGLPTVLSSDRGTQFTSELVGRVSELLGIKQWIGPSWRPQNVGSVERFHGFLGNTLRVALEGRDQRA